MTRRTLLHIPGAIGVDEAGRGPLAGPVVVAAVILPTEFEVAGLDDSKKLSPAAREAMAARIRAQARFAIVYGDLESIERRNILHATLCAMSEAVRALGEESQVVLIDGDRVPEDLKGRARSVVKGDGTYACIAAASILAKTERDRHMREMGERYPAYGFERHFGYAAPEHLEAIRRLGPCPIHRLSFRPFADDAQPCLTFGE